MIYREIPPPALLAGFVRHFWYIKQEVKTGVVTPFRLMADGFPSLIFQYQHQFRSFEDASITFPKTLLLGHTCNFRDLRIDGNFSMFGVALFPYTAPLLFKTPGKEIADSVISGEDILKHEDKFLDEEIALAKNDGQQMKILTAYLVKQLNRMIRCDTLVQRAVQLITRSSGIVNIEMLAQNLGISRRHFERRFREQIGLPPKLFSRIIRFQHTLKYPVSHSLTERALSHGYADQAHFIRDFKSFSGINPKYYFKKQAECAENLMPM